MTNTSKKCCKPGKKAVSAVKTLRLPEQKYYPKSIFFRNETYTIKFARIEHWGDTDGDKKEIRLRKGMSPRETFLTLIHELIHVAEFEMGFYLKHKYINKLEVAFFELLVDNFI